MSDRRTDNDRQLVEAQAQALLALARAANEGQFDAPISVPEGNATLSELAVALQTMTAQLQAERAQRELVERQGQALLEAIQWVAVGNLDVQVQAPEGETILSDLVIGLEMMIEDLQEMMSQQVRTDLVEAQSQALLDVVQSVALGDLDVEVDVPEGVEVLSELAVGLEMMVDDLRDMMAEQERARAEIEAGRQQLEAALQEVLAVQKRYLQQEWTQYAAEERAPGYYRAAEEEGPTADAWLPAMSVAVQQAQPVADGDSADEATLALPIKLYDQVVGAFGFSREKSNPWTREELEAVETIVEQVGWALENQRLFDEELQARSLLTMRVNELDCLNDIGRKMDEAPAIPDLLAWVTERVPAAMSYPDLALVAIELDGETYGVAEALALPCQMVQSLQAGGAPVGRLTIAYRQELEFLDEESALLGDIARRLSGYIENRRLLEEIRGRAEELAILNNLAQALSAQLDVDQVLHETHQGVSRLLDARNFYIGLYDPARHEITFRLNVTESAVDQEIVTISADQGISGYIIRTRQPVLIQEDIPAWHARAGLPQVGESAACWLGVPLLLGDQALGVMAIQSYTTPRLYDEHDRDLLIAVASQAAIALQNARLFEQTQAALNETAMLFRVAQGLARAESQQEMFELVLPEYLRVLGLPQGGVMTLDKEGGGATLHALVQGGRLVPAGLRIPVQGNPPTEVALTTQEPVAITDVYNHELTASTMDLVKQLGYRSLLLVPILVRGEAVGLLGADSVDAIHEFTEREIALVRAVADQLGIAMENQRLLEEMQTSLAETEALYHVTRSVASFENVQDTLRTVADSVAETLPADRTALYLLDVDNRVVTGLVRGGPGADRVDPLTFEELWNGLSGWVLREGQPVISPKGAPDPRESADAQAHRVRHESGSIVVVPVRYRDKMLGTLTAVNRLDQPDFTLRDANLMMAMANQAAAAIENARLFEETRLRAEQQAILNEIGQILTSCQDVESVLDEAYAGARRLLGVSAFTITLYDAAQDEINLALRVVDNQVDRPLTVRPMGRGGLTDYLITTRQPLLLTDRVAERAQELGIARFPLAPGQISQSWLGAPMMVGERVVGAMVALSYTTPRAFDERSRDLLVALANQTALSLNNVRLLAETRAALAEVEAAHRSYLRRTWQDHLRQREMLARSGFLFDRSQVDRERALIAAPDLWRPEIERVLQEDAPATALGVETTGGDGDEQRAGLAIPIHVRGQTIGVLGVETAGGDRQWTDDDLTLLAAVGDQLGQTLETARLFADTQRRAERERLIGEITARLRASTDMRDILETAATELGQALGASRALVRIGWEGPEPPAGERRSTTEEKE